MMSGLEAFTFLYGLLAAVSLCILLFLHTPAGKHWMKNL